MKKQKKNIVSLEYLILRSNRYEPYDVHIYATKLDDDVVDQIIFKKQNSRFTFLNIFFFFFYGTQQTPGVTSSSFCLAFNVGTSVTH